MSTRNSSARLPAGVTGWALLAAVLAALWLAGCASPGLAESEGGPVPRPTSVTTVPATEQATTPPTGAVSPASTSAPAGATPVATVEGTTGTEPPVGDTEPLAGGTEPLAGDTEPQVGDTVSWHESAITLLAYPLQPYQSEQTDPFYKWPYKRFDIDRFRAEEPTARARTFRTLVLENDLLRITLLPELGGRILQVVHKPSGTRMFYENSVVKPTAWGPPQQGGWIALGGMEWDLPVKEHGYAWGEPWGYIPLQFGPQRAAVTLFTPQDGRALGATVTVALSAGVAAFELDLEIRNDSGELQTFDYWHNAMLAPGDGHGISKDVHIVLPTDSVLVHSTEDERLPAAGMTLSWPLYEGRDVSRLSTWTRYAGLFEYPAAHGPFAGVYDTLQDAGAVRIFPAQVARGSKIFALGGSQPLDPALYTDDDSAYIELHAGLSPSFSQQVILPAGESVSWSESWYPVFDMGDLDAANAEAALHVDAGSTGVTVTAFAVRRLEAEVVLLGVDGMIASAPALLSPGGPVRLTWEGAGLASALRLVRIQTDQGPVIEYDVLARKLVAPEAGSR